MPNIQALAKAVDDAQAELDRRKAALLAALGGAAPSAPRAVPPTTNGTVPVTQRVLQLLAAAPGGLSRQQLQDQLGDTAALHSALKKYAKSGRIAQSGGRGSPWKLAAKKKGPRP